MSTGISFPSNILRMIDIERGDILRSRFLIRMIEERYKKKNKEKNIHPIIGWRTHRMN